MKAGVVHTNSPKVKIAAKNMVIKSEGGVKNLIANMNSLMSRESKQAAARDIVQSGSILPYTIDRMKWLNRVGLKKWEANKIDKWNPKTKSYYYTEKQQDKAWDESEKLFQYIATTAIIEIYDNVKSGKAAVPKRK